MFVAHLPAGYLLSQVLRPWANRAERCAIMVGSLLPDTDLILFYFRDGQSIHHHSYLSHQPAFWGMILCAGLMISLFNRRGRMVGAVGVGALLHLILDTPLGAINWAWPLGDLGGPLIHVPATQDHWILSFLAHWTSAIEALICLIALIIWSRTPQRKTPGQ